MPVAEANTIIARWRADSYLAFLEIDFNREPSSGESSRTNTSGGRIATSTVVMVPNSLRTASFRSNVYGRPTSVPGMARDARSLPSDAQAELRRTAVRLVADGRSKTEVAGLLSVSRETVSRWMKAHREGGDRALDVRRRGRRRGHTKLSDVEQHKIAVLVAGRNPDQLKLPGFLWTRALVRDLIRQQLGVEVGQDTVGRYLRAWGMSPQKPMRRAYEQSDEAVGRWLEVEYPAIETAARRERAEILWLDESGLRSDHTAGRTWAPVGQTPITKGTGQRFRANLIAAISNTGTLRFRVFDERFT